MRKIFAIALLAAVFAGCETLGLKTIEMDSDESVERVAGTIEGNITGYKVISAHWYEGEELSNDMEYLHVEMVGADGAEYSQIFKVGGDYQGPGEIKPARGNRTYDFEAIQSLVPADFNTALIMSYIETAKSLLPENLNFESVNSYTMKIDPATGEKTSDFTLYVTEKGNKTSLEGRSIVTTYYEYKFEVTADGAVIMEE